MTAVLVFDRDGDAMAFATEEETAGYLEAVDVETGLRRALELLGLPRRDSSQAFTSGWQAARRGTTHGSLPNAAAPRPRGPAGPGVRGAWATPPRWSGSLRTKRETWGWNAIFAPPRTTWSSVIDSILFPCQISPSRTCVTLPSYSMRATSSPAERRTPAMRGGSGRGGAAATGASVVSLAACGPDRPLGRPVSLIIRASGMWAGPAACERESRSTRASSAEARRSRSFSSAIFASTWASSKERSRCS